MSENNLKKLVKAIPDYPQKDMLIQTIIRLQKKSIELGNKYEKANSDKLTIAHLLSKVNDELEQSLDNERRFVASVSHELRTPLTAILGYSELLEDTTLNNKQKRYLDYMVQSSHHLLSLISDLLDVAKLEDSRIELSLRECDLDDILSECVSLVQSRVTKDVKLISDIPLLDYSIMADNKRLKQIFINLLSNAAKFTKKGSIKFYVKEIQEIGDGKLRISVNVDDTGQGIAKETLATLFDPFQSTDKTQGTGLGLFISQQLAYLMDGEITVDTKEGIGSSFSATFEVDIVAKKEIGKELNGANIMMFAARDDFVMQISKELANFGANFQAHDGNNGDFTASLAQMVIGGKFHDIGIFDQAIFGHHTNNIAGTFKSINPDIKLVVISKEESDLSFSEFDLVLYHPITSRRLVKTLETIYSQEFYAEQENVDYSNLDVLVVEDVEINREYEKEMLDNFFSISCDTAVNGKDAVKKAKKREYDIILMDIRMPIMDGLEATRQIRKFNTEVPIICMSANVYKEDKIAAEEAGMDDFIEKPLEKSDIKDKLNKYLNTRHAAKALTTREQVTSDLESDINFRKKALGHLESNFDQAVATRLFGKALESIQSYKEQININFLGKDTNILSEDFHALKGVLANLGLEGLAQKAEKLERITKDGNLIEADDLRVDLYKYLDRLLENDKS